MWGVPKGEAATGQGNDDSQETQSLHKWELRTPTLNSSLNWAWLLARTLLVKKGLGHTVICPGSRESIEGYEDLAFPLSFQRKWSLGGMRWPRILVLESIQLVSPGEGLRLRVNPFAHGHKANLWQSITAGLSSYPVPPWNDTFRPPQLTHPYPFHSTHSSCLT